MSPRLGLSVERTENLLLQRVILSLNFQVNVRHFNAAFDDFAAELLPSLFVQPFLQQFGNHRASFAC